MKQELTSKTVWSKNDAAGFIMIIRELWETIVKDTITKSESRWLKNEKFVLGVGRTKH